MKHVLRCCTLFLAILGTVSAQAVEPLVLYDNFNALKIDSSKWSAQQTSGVLLEVAREIREYHDRLRLAARAVGISGPTPGVVLSRVRLPFISPDAVEAIEASVSVRKVEAKGCPGNSAPSAAAMRISGLFFNSGLIAPVPGNATDDVLGLFRVVRRSDSTDPRGVLQVEGRVFRCLISDCTSVETLNNPNFGSIQLGQTVRLRIQWDKVGKQFIFQRDNEPEVFAPYVVTDTFEPGVRTKRVEVAVDAANCSVAGSAAFMDFFVDNVFVNESAAPGP